MIVYITINDEGVDRRSIVWDRGVVHWVHMD